jgi:hypothetical protein
VTIARVLLAIVLPTLLGAGLWQLAMGRARSLAAWCASLGAGYLLGLVGWGWLLGHIPVSGTAGMFGDWAPWLAASCVVVFALVLRQGRRVTDHSVAASAASRRARRGLIVLALTMSSFALVILDQAMTLPTLTWDAWNAWLAKSKAWYFAGDLLPAAAFDSWLAQPAGSSIAVTAPHYPESIPRLGVWLASAAQAWNEGAVHALWPGAWVAMGLASFGYLRMTGMGAWHAALGASAFLTLPLVMAHASLAGYADLWLASLVLLAGLHLHRWKTFGRRADLLMLAICAALLPAIKLEGTVWLLCLVAALAAMQLPPRRRPTIMAATALVMAAAVALGSWTIPVPGLGPVGVRWGEMDIPGLGTMSLAWRPVMDEVLQALFLLSNWSLLWYLAPAIVLLHGRSLRGAPGLQAVAWFLAFAFLFLFFLFFFTDASRWAENFTSVNRVLMHVVPLTVVLLTMLMVSPPVPHDTARRSAD